ncbi:MAG: GNAT family N-acetyltransferase [Acidimicrobiales bacterium]
MAAREARADDLEVVTALCESAIAELRPNRGGDIWSQWEARSEPVGPALAQSIDDDEAVLLTGTIDDVVVGYSACELHWLHDGRLVGHLRDLYVMPEARGVGVGEALMHAVDEWCRKKGCVGVDSIALPGDRATKNFFESFGMVARALRVHRSL